MAVVGKSKQKYLFSLIFIGLVLTYVTSLQPAKIVGQIAPIPSDTQLELLHPGISIIKVGQNPSAIAVNPYTSSVYVGH